MIPWWLGAAVAAPPTCPDREEALQRYEHAVVWDGPDAAEEASERVQAALACGPVASPEEVARLWWAEAALLRALGNEAGAAEATAAARRMHDGPPPAIYGEALHEGGGEVEGGDGVLRVFPVPKGHLVAVDGEVQALPVTVAPGPHLVQIGRSPRRVHWATVVTLQPELELMVETHLPAKMPRQRQPRPMLTGVGIGIGAAGLAMLGSTVLTRASANRAYDAENFELGDAWVTVNRTLFASGLTTTLAGGALVIVGQW